jgi:hypothetical protein
MFIVAGSSGIWPEQKSNSPTRMACEYGPIAFGALSVWMMAGVVMQSSWVERERWEMKEVQFGYAKCV